MTLPFKILLAIHIVSGATGLFSGTLNIFRKKGDKSHRLTGKVFSWSMLTAGACSLVLAAIGSNDFLFIVGVFTLYMVSTGNRYLYLKMLGNGGGPDTIDRIITGAMLLAGILFIILGAYMLFKHNDFGIVLLVFGMLSLRFVRTDYKNYKGQVKAKNYWLLAHLQRMTGAYIAALTAFLVVNAKYIPLVFPPVIAWLLPTALLLPFIVKWSRKYAVKLKPTPEV